MITIQLNGKACQVEQGDLAKLVAVHQTDSNGLVVECNGSIIPQTDWENISLQDGDVIEMLRFVGGG